MSKRRLLFACVAFAIGAPTPQVVASGWNYGCKGALPVFNGSTVIIFNRDRLVLLPKSFTDQGMTLRYLAFGDATDTVIELANAADNNSGLAPTMVFTHVNKPEKKLTLTEISSKTVSDAGKRARAQPRNSQGTYSRKIFRYVNGFRYLGQFDVKMDLS